MAELVCVRDIERVGDWVSVRLKVFVVEDVFETEIIGERVRLCVPDYMITRYEVVCVCVSYNVCKWDSLDVWESVEVTCV